jgi:hypothetical protein
MSDEVELARKQTALVKGLSGTKMGNAILTSDRLVFVDTKFMSGVTGGALGTAVAATLQKRHEAGGPMLDLPLSSITGLRREKKMLNKDRMAVITGTDEYLFNDGWSELSPKLRELLADRHGKQLTETGPDSFEVS